MTDVTHRPVAAAVDTRDHGNGVEVRWRAQPVAGPKRARSRKWGRPAPGARGVIEALLMAGLVATLGVALHSGVWPGGTGV